MGKVNYTPPEGWKRAIFGQLAEFINGYAFAPDDWREDGLPIIRIQQLRDEKAKSDYYDRPLPERYKIQNGDVIFSWSASLITRFWYRGDAYLNQHLFKVKNYAGVDRAFLKHLIDFNIISMAGETHGSTMKHITRPLLLNFEVAIPEDIVEQRKIAEILAIVDDAIEQSEALIRKYQRIKQGLMQDLLTRGVDENGEMRPDISLAPQKYKQSMLGWIPREWNVKQVKDVAEMITSGSRGWANYYADEGALFLRIGNLTREHINLRFNDVQRVQAPKNSEGHRTSVMENDILVSITADLGIVGVIPQHFEQAYVNQHIALVRLHPGATNARWLGHFLAGHAGQKQFIRLNESGAKSGLSLPTVGKLYFADPGKSERKKIVEILDAHDRAIEMEKRQLVKLQSLKRGLLHDLLTGQVRAI